MTHSPITLQRTDVEEAYEALLRRPWNRVAKLMVCVVMARGAGWLTWTANEGKAAVLRIGEHDFSAVATHLIHGLASGGVGAFFGWVC